MRQLPTSSASAKCARISATDHFSGAARLVSCFLLHGLMCFSSFLAVSFWTVNGSLPSTLPRMRCTYCCGVSCMSPPKQNVFREVRLAETQKRTEKESLTGDALAEV